jgi:hypothetical protein
MVSILTSSAVDCGFSQTKNYQIGICCFNDKYEAKRRVGSKSGQSVRVEQMSTSRLLFQ